MKSYDELKAEMETIQQQMAEAKMNRPQFAGGSKVSMDGAYGKK